MLFTSFEFLEFALLFFLTWPLVRRSGRLWLCHLFLCVTSLAFYAYWAWWAALILVTTGLVDFYAAGAMVRYSRRRTVLFVLSLSLNLACLAVFKYSGFLAESLNGVLHAMQVGGSIPVIHLALPIGISFYTFQSMSYTLDVYRGNLRPTSSFLHFLASLSLFAHLVAGPIVRSGHLLPQLESIHGPTPEQQEQGLELLAIGFFKKMVVADNLAPVVDQAFASSSVAHSAPYWWLVTTLFAFQIYYDFSGYTDIARGLAKWIGCEFDLNFNHPYCAHSFRDFWSRWHISLSTWFRDYVYVPLGGSREGKLKALRNVWITFLLSGLWHGASWNFVLWGAFHAACLSIEQLTARQTDPAGGPLNRILRSLVVLACVWVGWVIFRATDVGQAARIILTMFDATALSLREISRVPTMALAIVALCVGREVIAYSGWAIGSQRAAWLLPLKPVLVAVLITSAVFLRGSGKAFVYFQF